MNVLKEGKKVALIGCNVFREELDAYADLLRKFDSIDVLEMGLHDYPDTLRERLQEKIDVLEQDDSIEYIVLAYGVCGGGTIGLQTRKACLVLPKAHDCISILLGNSRRHEALQKEKPSTYFYSPGWVREKKVPGPDREKWLRSLYQNRFDEEMIDELVEADEEAYSIYTTAGYVDITNNCGARSYCKECSCTMGWEFKDLQGDEKWWVNLLSGSFDADQFLILQPGEITSLADGQEIVKAKVSKDGS